jgi:hypothetical protein
MTSTHDPLTSHLLLLSSDLLTISHDTELLSQTSGQHVLLSAVALTVLPVLSEHAVAVLHDCDADVHFDSDSESHSEMLVTLDNLEDSLVHDFDGELLLLEPVVEPVVQPVVLVAVVLVHAVVLSFL